MRFLVLVPGNEVSESGVMPDLELITRMGQFNEEMVKAGVLLAGEGLHSSAKGARIRFAGNPLNDPTAAEPTVALGPFASAPASAIGATGSPAADPPALVAGFWVIRTSSLEEAVGWMRRAPFGEGVVLEIRQIQEAEDFGESLPPELREQEARLRSESAARERERSK